MRRYVWLSCIAMVGWVGCKTPFFERGESQPERQVETPTANQGRPPNNPKELGWVRWQRNFDTAVAESKASGKPIFLLFQEVPGCSTCVGFGESVLAHPLIVEAIESEFVPVAIHNNLAGADRAVLTRFGEPAWNNPVVRFVDSKGEDLIARQDGLWSTHEIAKRMVQSLRAAGRPVPDYLQWTVHETDTTERATFAMGCYWSGEACLASLPGVVKTSAGWWKGREVVVVDFDQRKLSEADLKSAAAKHHCGEFVARSTSVRNASDADRKYHLKRSSFRYLPLAPLQATRVNSALAKGENPRRWLSPRQRELHRTVEAAGTAALVGLTAPEKPKLLASYEALLRERLAQR